MAHSGSYLDLRFSGKVSYRTCLVDEGASIRNVPSLSFFWKSAGGGLQEDMVTGWDQSLSELNLNICIVIVYLF